MFNVSPAFLAAVRDSHSVVSSVQIIQPGQTGTVFEGRTLAVVDGSVTLDATADVRGSLDLTVTEKWPSGTGTFDIAPYGTEVFVTRGIVFGNGSVQRVPLGIYRIITVEQENAPKGTLRITGQDRMQGIIEAKVETAVSPASTDTFGTIVNALVKGGVIQGATVNGPYPAAVIQWLNADGTTDATTPATATGRAGLVVEQDRYSFLDDLITGLGKIWYFDYRGVLIIKPLPTNTDPVFDVSAGDGGVLVSAHRILTRDGIFNAVVVTGESYENLPPPAYTAYDLDPTSPTYYNGNFGKVPYFFTSSTIKTPADSINKANTLLAQFKGLPYDVDFTMIPNPALEPYDPVRIIYPIDITQNPHVKMESHLLSQVVIGLGSTSGMACGTKLISSNAA